MSLEEIISKNTAAVEANNALLEKLVARAMESGAVSNSAASDDKPKRNTRAKKTDTDESGDSGDSGDGNSNEASVSADDVKKLVGEWLGEFKDDENDPETDARKAAIKEALKKLTKKDGAKLTDVPEADLPRVVAWLDKKKEADAGHGKGRLTEKPSADGGSSEEDDI
jgi:hypothetical protein